MARPVSSPDLAYPGLAILIGGFALAAFGPRLPGLGLLGLGALLLEWNWRQDHPHFRGGLGERFRWAGRFYAATHQHPTNRWLHIVGIPIIVVGTVGMVVFRPGAGLVSAWGLCTACFTVGWVLNFIGHGVYEKAAPAFLDDPLSFLAGPIWDFQQLRGTAPESPEGR